MYEAFDTYFFAHGIDLLVPVPLHPSKTRKRGFNQAYLLIRRFQKFYRQQYGKDPSWQIDTRSLVRVKPTLPQTGLDSGSRQENLKNAFKVRPGAGLKEKRILLVDDVFTTGSTCYEAARVLGRAGAGRVDALVLARA